MNWLLVTKLRRDIWASWPQFLAVLTLIFLGLLSYKASSDSYQNLRSSYEKTHEKYHFADIWINGEHFTPDQVGVLEDHPEVEEVWRRMVHMGQVSLPLGQKIEVRTVGFSKASQPPVNQLHLVEGDYFENGQDIIVEKHFSDFHELKVGDQLTLTVEARTETYQVAGIAIDPEYIFLAKSRQEILATPDNFGVVYLPFEAWPEGTEYNELLVETKDSLNAQELQDLQEDLKSQIEGSGALTSYERSRQPATEVLTQDLEAFRELSVFFPFLFLSIAALSIFVIMSRLIHEQRPLIGVMKANGFGTVEVVIHYLSFGFLLSLVGAVSGLLLGWGLANFITRIYTEFLSIPIVETSWYWDSTIIGLIMAFVIGLGACYLPARLAIWLPPASAMRGETPVVRGQISWLERLLPFLRRLPLLYKTALRGIERNWKRSISTFLGILFSAMLIMVSWGMLDSINHLVYHLFERNMKQDLVVAFDSPQTAQEIQELAELPGVRASEGGWEIGLNVSRGEMVYSTQLVVMGQTTVMRDFLSNSGQSLTLPKDGVLISQGFTTVFPELEVGDEFMVELSPQLVELFTGIAPTTSSQDWQALSWPVRVEGLVDDALGSKIYASQAFWEESTGLSEAPLAFLQIDREFKDDLKRVFYENSEVVSLQDSRALEEMIREQMVLFYAFVGVMLGFGSFMAFGLIFNTMTVNIMERKREIATLRTLGFSRRQITGVITLENLLLVILGLPGALVAGYYLSEYALKQFNNDLYQISFVMRWQSIVLVAVIILVSGWLSQWPALRALHRMDLTKVIKERVS